jgi:CheY-like chemotaxis protein/two-component sensor histidine kinase
MKGPLYVLRLSLQSLSLKETDSEAREILQGAEAAFDEVVSLSDDLLDALRFGAGVVALREEGITLANLFDDVRRRFRRRANEQGVQLRVAKTRVYCVADRHYLQRILGNLVENAFKHSKASKVLVGARLRAEDRLLLEVIDNGRGIPERELPFVFEEWFRGCNAVSEAVRGQGLGLWAVQRCAETMGGIVSVESEPGRGCRFVVDLPLFAERRPPLATVENVLSNCSESKLVAVLDDDEDVLRALRTSFETIGVRVFAASDDLHFLTQISAMARAPDLFLLDFNLAGQTVERTLSVLRSRFGSSLNAIIISGRTNDGRLRQSCLDFPVLSKPLTASNIRSIISVLNRTIPCEPGYFN